MTNYEKYFGTPERAAIMAVQNNGLDAVSVSRMDEDAWFTDIGEFDDVDAYHDWLESEVEDV